MEIEEGSLDNGLNQETWLKIFGYLPKRDRENVLLVNSLFNKLICEIEKFKYVLKVTEHNFTDIGILWTKRRFNEVKFERVILDNLHLIGMCDILSVHGKTIETMTISTKYDSTAGVKTVAAYRILSLFECIPNLKSLNWDAPTIQIDKWFPHEPPLEKLNYLRLKICPETPLDFAYIFTPGTIKTFSIAFQWKYLKEFLACQSNIKDLTLEWLDPNIDVNDFNHLQLETLTSRAYGSGFIVAQIITRHPELKRVADKSLGWLTPFPLLRAYCTLINLEYIELKISNQNLDEVHRIADLPNLREIKFDLERLDSETDVIQVVSIQLPKVEKVSLVGNLTNVSILETAGRNWPNVKDLEVEAASKFNNGIDVLNFYLDNFVKLESLVIKVVAAELDDDEVGKDIIPFEMLSFMFYSQQYPLLKRLTVQGASILNLDRLITALPNLELLHIENCRSSIYSTNLLNDLMEHKHLKHLRGTFTEQSKVGRFSPQEAAWLKKLCRRLKSFKISFGGNEDFQKSIRTLLTGCDIFTVEIEHADYDDAIELLTILENVKF